MLLVVGDEVLHARRHPAALQALDVGHGQLGGEHRVLGEALEVAAAERRALEVDGGAEQHVGALGARLLGQRRARPARPASTSHVAPSAAPHGNDTDGGPPAKRCPRTPLGPSLTRNAATSPEAGTFHQSDPERGRTSSSASRQAPGFQIIR